MTLPRNDRVPLGGTRARAERGGLEGVPVWKRTLDLSCLLVAAPVLYAYLKQELLAARLVGAAGPENDA